MGWKRDFFNASLSFYKANSGSKLDDISYDTIQVQSGVVHLQPASNTSKGLSKL